MADKAIPIIASASEPPRKVRSLTVRLTATECSVTPPEAIEEAGASSVASVTGVGCTDVDRVAAAG